MNIKPVNEAKTEDRICAEPVPPCDMGCWICFAEEYRAKIERLTAALTDVVTTDSPLTSDDWFQEWKNLAFKLKGIARRALEGK